MQLALTEAQEALSDEVRSYFVRLVEEVEGAGAGEPTYARYIRRMGEDGWLGLGWPTEYGGQARGPIDQMIFVEESHWAGVPLPLLVRSGDRRLLESSKRRLLLARETRAPG